MASTAALIAPVVGWRHATAASVGVGSIAGSNEGARRQFEEDQKEQEEEKKKYGTYFMVVTAFAGAVVVCSGLAMITILSPLGFLAFGIPIAISPVVVYQQSQISSLPSLRHIQNMLRRDVNEFMKANDVLAGHNDRLKGKCDKLKGLESQLQDIVQREGKDLERMKNIVKENAIIIKKMKKLQAAVDLQDLMNIVFQSDRDEDGHLDDREWKRLVTRLKAFKVNNAELEFDEDELRKEVETKGTGAVMSIISMASEMINETDKPAALQGVVTASQRAAEHDLELHPEKAKGLVRVKHHEVSTRPEIV